MDDAFWEQTLHSALRLALQGLRVFPIVADPVTGQFKKPALAGWPLLSTTDPRTIRAWWDRERRRGGRRVTGVGVHTVGFAVLDIDGPPGGASLARLNADGRPTPPTLRIDSGNTAEPGHYQLLYRLPAGRRLKAKALRAFRGFEAYPAIDVRSSGGQVVGPGSYHRSGGRYAWAAEPADPAAEAAEAPPWLLGLAEAEQGRYARVWASPELAARRGGRKRGGGPPDALVTDYADALRERFAITGPGQRYAQTLRATLWLARRGVAEAETLRLGADWLAGHCDFFEADPAAALDHLGQVTAATYRRLAEGKVAPGLDHQKLSADLRLHPSVSAWLARFGLPPATSPSEAEGQAPVCPSAAGVHEEAAGRTSSPRQLPDCCDASSTGTQACLCSSGVCVPVEDGVKPPTGSERNFLAALLHHVQYELATKGYPGRVLMTVRQLAGVHERLTGRTLSMSTYYTHANKFVGRPGRAASRRELLRLERAGAWGEASTFELTGLAEAFAGVARAGLNHDDLRRGRGPKIEAGTPPAARGGGLGDAQSAGGGETGRSAPTVGAKHRTPPQPAGRAGVVSRPASKPRRAEVPRAVPRANVERRRATIPADPSIAIQRGVPDTPNANDEHTGCRTSGDGPDSTESTLRQAGYQDREVEGSRDSIPPEDLIDSELNDLLSRLRDDEG